MLCEYTVKSLANDSKILKNVIEQKYLECFI